MSEICNGCGLPKELCVCNTIKSEGTTVTLKMEKARYGKEVIHISGVDPSLQKDLATEMKTKCATGGTVKDNEIQIQGQTNKRKVMEILKAHGFVIKEYTRPAMPKPATTPNPLITQANTQIPQKKPQGTQ